MIEPDWQVGDTCLSFLFDRSHNVIHKLPGKVVAKRGLLSAINHFNKPGGEYDLVINGWIVSVLNEDESDLMGGRFRQYSETNFTLKNDVHISQLMMTSEMLDWMSDHLVRPWGVRNIFHHVTDEEGKPKSNRKTYLSFERAKDAILFKLRWIG